METKIGTALKSRLQSAQDHDTFDVNIFLKGEPAIAVLSATDFAVDTVGDQADRIARMQKAADQSQSDLLEYLDGIESETLFLDNNTSVPKALPRQTFWINNSVAAEVTLEVLQEILKRSDVVHVELSRHVDLEELLDLQVAEHSSLIGDDVAIDSSEATWSVKRINAPLVWQENLKGEGVLVAVVDTGVNYDHPDLKDHMWDGGAEYPKHGYDFGDKDIDPRDDAGHGTACAGIVAGNGSAGSQTGVAPKATVMALRAGNSERSIWDALEFAILHRANVISMSMSWKYPSHPDYPGWRRTCESILAAGVLHANSIGNQGDLLATYPIPYNIAAPGNSPPPRLHPKQTLVGTLSSAISCGATDDTDSLANFSGRGPAAWESGPYLDYPYDNGAKQGLTKPDICAPGPGTSSCNWQYPSQPGAKPYRTFGGTSAATPHIGGCLVLLAQACQKAGNPIVPARIQEALENTAVKINGQTKDKENHYGAGRVDIYKAYKYGQDKGWW